MLIRYDIAPENYLANEADYPAVFPVSDNGKMKEGVATLIHRKWAVTAAHCAVDLYKADFENHPFLVRIGGKENIVDWAVAPEQVGSVRVIRDFCGKLKKVKVKVRDESYDIALLRLKDEVKHVSPVPLYQNGDEVGKQILLLGWGDFGTGDRGLPKFQLVNDGQFRLAENKITGVNGNYLTFQFDNSNSQDVLPLEGVNGSGDSGSPALVNTENGMQLIGVSSRGRYRSTVRTIFDRQGRYGWQEYYIRVSKMYSWINQVINESS
ncbi:MAG: trypsin-like serine protease [Leptolyngbya sp. BL-A-14]